MMKRGEHQGGKREKQAVFLVEIPVFGKRVFDGFTGRNELSKLNDRTFVFLDTTRASTLSSQIGMTLT